MKIKLPRFAQLWQRVRDIWTAKVPVYVEITPGACALVFPDVKTYHKLVDALSDARLFTGINYSKKVLRKSTLIKN